MFFFDKRLILLQHVTNNFGLMHKHSDTVCTVDTRGSIRIICYVKWSIFNHVIHEDNMWLVNKCVCACMRLCVCVQIYVSNKLYTTNWP